ncbi:MAG: protein-L-isoaspartate(D-aspartate) O-methyltransferase [Candidatus Altarchaeaceae archaeon]
MSDEFEKQRKNLVEILIKNGELKSKKVIDAFLKVERHKFVPDEYKHRAYNDEPLSIGYGQTISAPSIVAIMIEALDINENDKILEIGTGSGYTTCILAEIAKNGKIFTIERIEELANKARERLKDYKNVEVIVGDGTKGYEKEKFYDKIIVSACASKIPKKLIEQLKDNGKMVIPVGGDVIFQELILIEKEKGKIKEKFLTGCSFVPLIGEY